LFRRYGPSTLRCKKSQGLFESLGVSPSYFGITLNLAVRWILPTI
jgi:hypothetical protein